MHALKSRFSEIKNRQGNIVHEATIIRKLTSQKITKTIYSQQTCGTKRCHRVSCWDGVRTVEHGMRWWSDQSRGDREVI